jgi:hypothetical protein
MKIFIDKHGRISKGRIIGITLAVLLLVGFGICLIPYIESTLKTLGVK